MVSAETQVHILESLSMPPDQPECWRPVSGGSINQAYRMRAGRDQFFVKINRREKLEMFQAEYDGLQELRSDPVIGVPEPLVVGSDEVQCWLVCEYVELTSGANDESHALLGEQLAALHQCSAIQFGWWRDNTIGSTPQVNGWHDDWASFFGDQRLRYLLGLLQPCRWASDLIDKGERVVEVVDRFLSHHPAPSRLHGDLWSGNYGFDQSGRPYIFDPAVYYGDREVDLAMTELFGGFSSCVYQAYQSAWPIDAGYQQRKKVYNLYHILNHACLFGSSYGVQALRMMDQILAEI